MNDQLASLRQEVETALREMNLPAEPANLYDPVRYILQLGGKRIRPILTLMGCALFGRPYGEAMNQALAVEIFHNFTLVHDDIMDSADVRRNLPTVHKKWDHNVAILSGDGMMVVAYQFLFKAPSEKLASLGKVFSETALEVCEGQQLDMDYAQRDAVSLEEYLYMIRRKTAVLLGGSMQLGAIMADASLADQERIKQFAAYMGLAFQIRDDYLDSFGEQDSFGKLIGGDIREGKRTWLTIKAFEEASPAQREELKRAFSNEHLDDRVAKVLEVYDALHIKASAQAEIERYSEMSLGSLEGVTGEESVKAQLKELVAYLMGRDI